MDGRPVTPPAPDKSEEYDYSLLFDDDEIFTPPSNPVQKTVSKNKEVQPFPGYVTEEITPSPPPVDVTEEITPSPPPISKKENI